jgi:hypothetical protein
MPVNDIIKTSDYNTLRNSIIQIIGNGSATYGYGQPVRSSAKANDELISQADWDLLRFDIVNARLHQDGTPPTIKDIQEGELLSFSNNTQYTNLITTATSLPNRLIVGSGQFLTEPATTPAGAALTTSRAFSLPTTSWNSLLQCEITVGFTNSDLCRWFFNSGGEIRIISSRTGGTNNAQNNDWSSLLASAGQRAFSAQSPETGLPPPIGSSAMNARNFYRLTSTYQNYYSLLSSSPYTSNSYNLDARCDVADNRNGTATTVYLRVRFVDNYTDPGPGGPPFTVDAVDGTFTVTVNEKRATGTLLPSGTFTITRPTYSITALGGT